MQNDKVAASRAIAQNRQLKIQLEELEKAFIQLVNLFFSCVPFQTFADILFRFIEQR